MNIKMNLCTCLILFTVFLSGCSSVLENNQSENKDSIEMTETEISLLYDTYLDEDILVGQIDGTVEIGFKQLRAGLSYLSDKYPNDYSNFEIISFTPANQFKKWGVILFKYLDKDYSVNISPQSNGYDCSDNLYTAFITDKYSHGIENILSDNGYFVKVYTEFYSYTDENFDVNSSFEDILSKDLEAFKNIHIYINSESYNDFDIQNILNQYGVYGSCTVYFTHEIYESIDYLENNRINYLYNSFNCGY